MTQYGRSNWSGDDHERFNQLVRVLDQVGVSDAFKAHADNPADHTLRDVFPEAFGLARDYGVVDNSPPLQGDQAAQIAALQAMVNKLLAQAPAAAPENAPAPEPVDLPQPPASAAPTPFLGLGNRRGPPAV